ncbi:hypothetical protein YC2023_015435 [Brassica napus]
MNSDAGSFVARRRRRFSDAFHLFVSLPLSFTMLLHEFLVCLGFLSSFAITSFRRCLRCRLYVLWPLRALLSRPMSLDGSNPGSLQKPLKATHTDDCSIFLSLFELNDQRLGAGSVKSPCLHHGNAGVGSSCLESTLVPLELCVKLISVLTGMKMTNCLLPDSVLRKIRSVVLWFEPGNISGSLFSKIASSEHFSCSAHDGRSLQAAKFLYADSHDLIHSPLIVFVLCSEYSQGSQYASVNSY